MILSLGKGKLSPWARVSHKAPRKLSSQGKGRGITCRQRAKESATSGMMEAVRNFYRNYYRRQEVDQNYRKLHRIAFSFASSLIIIWQLNFTACHDVLQRRHSFFFLLSGSLSFELRHPISVKDQRERSCSFLRDIDDQLLRHCCSNEI